MPADEEDRPLWPDRHLTDGRLVIAPPRTARRRDRPRVLETVVGAVAATGRRWRALDSGQKTAWGIALFVFTGGVGLLVPLVGVLVLDSREEQVRTALHQPPMAASREATLAAWDTIEARVAAAASRAWAETQREPSWHSPFLAGTRAAFDGDAEVAQVVDLADRIRQARYGLGPRPTGPAAEYWDRQQRALDDAARRLGGRADALIRHRDQAAALAVELQHLADLERLERSAAEVDVLTVETARGSGRGDGGLGDVAQDIAAVRRAMTDLLELMTRTRAPLAEPPDLPG